MARTLGRISDPVHGRSGVIKSVQRGTGTTSPSTITSVDMAHSVAEDMGLSNAINTAPEQGNVYLSSATAVVHSVGSGATVGGFQVVEREA